MVQIMQFAQTYWGVVGFSQYKDGIKWQLPKRAWETSGHRAGEILGGIEH